MLKLASILLSLCLPLSAQVYKVTKVGEGCGGADLVGYLTDVGAHKKLHADCTGLFPHEKGWVVWGTEKLPPVVLPNGCPVWTNFIYGHTFMSDPAGTWEYSHSWPLSIRAQFYIQVTTFRYVNNQLELKTTDCYHYTNV